MELYFCAAIIFLVLMFIGTGFVYTYDAVRFASSSFQKVFLS